MAPSQTQCEKANSVLEKRPVMFWHSFGKALLNDVRFPAPYRPKSYTHPPPRPSKPPPPFISDSMAGLTCALFVSVSKPRSIPD